ncbi:cysteinyl-tRNA synthetase [Kineosphaera limosa]|jgi:cysteinyl-tRNA synthetase|uniref:Cysteine--tRNA ligase n=2 Tax=Actinomycetes TaxID=1760 RepID=K6WR81_9MICO|nr:cysteinyl-tRNA synthetase [Kineosphaera limosa]GAB94612.1 cysteine--tRNA ligase [Kineosphaera limosa NBRC 100340]
MLRIYDSAVRELRSFVPLTPGRVSIYVCGPTVQSAPHIGHLRSALVYDLWRRWLTHRGYAVTLVRNVTDVDDKVLDLATETEPWWARAYRVETEFARSYTALGVLPPTHEPRTSGHIPQALTLIERLLRRGHAYVAGDGSGDVYFDVSSWQAYGTLTRQTPDAVVDPDEGPGGAKTDPRDFALWKGAKPSDPASARWRSPWGTGRPGWHIQCSAMSRHYLGRAFDIHGGGLDLRFPHHENELAQSTAAGEEFAKYWVHNGLVTVGGQKMAKSLDNSLYADELLRRVGPATLRYYLLSAHYRSALDYHQEALAHTEAAVTRIATFQRRARTQLANTASDVPKPPIAFAAALDDDLNVPAALAVLHDHVRAGNIALDNGDAAAVMSAYESVLAMTEVLGAEPGGFTTAPRADVQSSTISTLVEVLLANRSHARDAGDFSTADRIRNELASAGIAIQDHTSGTTWTQA